MTKSPPKINKINTLITQSVTIDIQTAIDTNSFRSILSFCKQWNIKDIYIKLQSISNTEIFDQLQYLLTESFLFTKDDFRFYLHPNNLEHSFIKKLWGMNTEASDFILPFLIHTSSYETHTKSIGKDIIRFLNTQPEIYTLKTEKNSVQLNLKYPDHVYSVMMMPVYPNSKEAPQLNEVNKYFNPVTGKLKFPWKETEQVSIFVLRKFYGWYNGTVRQKLNISQIKILTSYLKYLKEETEYSKNLISGWILNPLFEFPEIPNVLPLISDLEGSYEQKTGKGLTTTIINCMQNINDNFYHYCYELHNFLSHHILENLENEIKKFQNKTSKKLKFFIKDNSVQIYGCGKQFQFIDFVKLFDDYEISLDSNLLLPTGDYANKNEEILKVLSSIMHHYPGKSLTVHCDDLLNTKSSFEYKMWQFHWLISCGISNFNRRIIFSETEKLVDLYNNLPSFDPSYSAYQKWFEYINQMTNMISQGTHKCDILVLYPSVTNNCGNSADILTLVQSLTNNGFDFDFIDFNTFLNQELCQIEEKSLSTKNEKYSVLIIPAIEVIQFDVLQKIKLFYESGGTIIAVGEVPSKAYEWNKDNEVEKISNEIWFKKSSISSTKFKTNQRGGKGFFQKDINQLPEILLDNSDLINFKADCTISHIRSIIREMPREYYIFLFNISQDKSYDGTIYSKYKGNPYSWNFDRQIEEPIHTFTIKDMFLQIPVRIHPKKAKLIKLKKESLKEFPRVVSTNIELIDAVNVDRNQINLTGTVEKPGEYHASINIHNYLKMSQETIDDVLPVLKISNNNWNIYFDNKKYKGDLTDLSRFSNIGCGKINYRKIIVISKQYLSDYKLTLDLGTVYNTIEIIINQKHVDSLLAGPYILDVTDYITEGDNKFEFVVSNNLSSKLSCLSFYKTNGSSIQESGLIGPIRIIPKKKIRINF